MSYQVIARKYRPQTFEEVVGQRPIVTTLQNAVEQRRLHHAYLFSGPRGVGKTTVARLLAKSLNCAQGPTPRPCNACASCAEITSSRSMDVLEIDGASNRGIENIRELRETVRYAPARDRYKVFIIDEVHMLTDPAWNALLKTLEEPPPQVVFVFATTEYRELPRTILSRCQHFEFRKVAPADLLAHLRHVADGEKVTVEPSAFELIARVAEGSLRDALSALDQVIAFSGASVTDEQARTILGVVDRELILGFYEGVRERDCARLVAIVDTVFEKGYQPVEFLEDLLAHGRDLLLLRAVPDAGKFVAGTEEDLRALTARAAAFTEDELLRILELLTREEPRIRNSSHARFLLEALGIKLARLADLRPIEELLAQVEAAGPSADAGAAPAAPTGARTAAPGGSGFGIAGTSGVPPRSSGTAGARVPAAGAPVPEAGAPLPAAGTPVSAADAPAGSEALVEALLRRIHGERAAVGAMLEQAAWIQIDGDRLRVVLAEKHGFFRDRLQSRDVSDYVRRVTREMAGTDLRLEVESAAPDVLPPAPAAPRTAAPPAAPGPASIPRVTDTVVSDRGGAPRARTSAPGATRPFAGLKDDAGRRALLEQAMQEPSLRSVLELFDGEIVDIEPV